MLSIGTGLEFCCLVKVEITEICLCNFQQFNLSRLRLIGIHIFICHFDFLQKNPFNPLQFEQS